LDPPDTRFGEDSLAQIRIGGSQKCLARRTTRANQTYPPRSARCVRAIFDVNGHPADRRAKLIFPTTRGRQALDDAGNRVAEIEQHWRGVLTEQRFDDMCATMQDLLKRSASESAPGRW